MTFKQLSLAALLALLPSLASAHMIVSQGYARSSNPQAGAAFMTITNHSPIDDRVVSVSTDAAVRAELHTHIEDTNGVMRMIEVEDGFPIAASDTIRLERGGAHVMFMGIDGPWEDGEEITFTIEFEHADPVTVTFAVDNQRGAGGHGGHGDHGTHGHGDHNHDS